LWFLTKIPTLQWRAVHFTLKSAMVSYLNHTPCSQHDYTATKAIDILLYTYSL